MAFRDWFKKKPGSSNVPGVSAEFPTNPGQIVNALSLLPPDIAFKHGFAAPAVAGFFRQEKPDDLSPENFLPNEAFIETLHRIIRDRCPTLPGFGEAARQQKDGSLSIIDMRTPEGVNGNVPPEDIVGAFAVNNGIASSQTYHPNPNYRVYTRHGLTRLPDPLQAILIEELKQLTINSSSK